MFSDNERQEFHWKRGVSKMKVAEWLKDGQLSQRVPCTAIQQNLDDYEFTLIYFGFAKGELWNAHT